ncbi:hypothetical protein KIN20_025886 [Parelaphostrongylus tenuis]|uniref:Uncharacterized protein n=1 Tax=Parelaphostrongylus tenuis TaxID=148309 RepID=A0AAD5MVU5_PARTN|nr:hypothetical protein KIN20_025886 [Parelaphostrongylus tenuis]
MAEKSTSDKDLQILRGERIHMRMRKLHEQHNDKSMVSGRSELVKLLRLMEPEVNSV